jgi:hypothetical protein
LHTRLRHQHGKSERRHGPPFYVKSSWNVEPADWARSSARETAVVAAD